MAKRWFTIQNKADAPAAEILIYGTIGKDWDGEGTGAKEFREAFNAIPAGRKINVHINSPGGVISEGFGIYNTMLPRAGDITTFNDGYALSCGSFLMLAGDTRKAPKNAIFMTHKPSGGVYGDANDMRQYADILDVHQDSIASIYMQRAGLSEADANALMETETWMNAEEAKSKGFVTELIDGDAATNAFDLSQFAFKNLPEALRPANANTQLPNQADNTSSLSGAVQGGIGVSPTETTEAPRNKGATNERIIMNRDEMIALLKNRGVTVPDNCTDQWLKDEVAKLQPATNGTTTTGNTEGTANTGAANNVITLSPETITALATAMSTQTANTLPGAAPLNVRPRVENLGSVARNSINAHARGKARFEFLRDNWNELSGQLPVLPIVNANTTDSTALTTDMLASGLIVVLQNRLAGLQGFTRDFGTDRLKPNAKVQVPIATAGGTAQSNATAFEDADNFIGTIDNVEIAPARITSGAHLTAAELNNGFRMAQFAEIKAHELADKIQSLVNAVITSTNFDRTTELGAAALVSAFAAFGKSDLDNVWAALEKSSIKNVMLAGGYYKAFLPATLESFNPLSGNTLPGWDGFYLNTYWTGAEANTRGFACNPQAIAVASGLPLASPNRGMTTQVETITLPGIGLTVEQQQWYSTSSKTDWANWEVMFGAAKGDPAAGCLIKIA